MLVVISLYALGALDAPSTIFSQSSITQTFKTLIFIKLTFIIFQNNRLTKLNV